MKSFKIRRPSPALVLSMIALFVSLGGVSYGVATGSIDSREIKNNSVRSGDIRNETIRSRDINDGTVNSRDVRPNALTGSDVKEATLGTVPGAQNAGLAFRALNADNATTVDTLQTSNIETVAEGGVVTLFTYGPFTIVGGCVDAGGGTTTATAAISTSENNTIVDGDDGSDGDFDAADGRLTVQSITDGADDGVPAPSDAQDNGFHAMAPGSLKSLSAAVFPVPDATLNGGTCRFSGHLIAEG